MLEASPNVTERTADVQASDALKIPEVAELVEIEADTLKEALAKVGVTPVKIAQKINVLLDAEKVTKITFKGGKVTEYSEQDHNAIDKGLKHATAIYGVADPDRPRSSNTYNFFFNPELRKKVEVVEGEIKQALLKDVPEN